MTGSLRYAGLDPNSPGTADPNVDRAYAYDPIGNRTVSRRGTDPNTLYTANNLNQYTAIDDPAQELGSRLVHDPDGNLTELYAAADVDGDGVIDQDDIDFILFCFGTTPGDPNCGMSSEEFARADVNSNGVIDQDDVDAVMFYFGTTISETLSARLTWDGENRLTGWAPRVPQAGSKKLDFRYDYRNRRVEKKVSTYSGSAWAVSDVRRFVWSDWLMLAELKGDPNEPNEPNKYKVERYYTWGLDLAGLSGSLNSLQSAGGIGGLLACRDPNDPNAPNDLYGDFLYFFDGNGNVGQLVDAAGSPTAAPVLAAKYEYDPYGNTLRAPADPNSGPYAAANPMRFSTKPRDDETGLGNWGERYFDGVRWLSRDPRFEAGGTNLYVYTVNAPLARIDAVGLDSIAQDISVPCSCNDGTHSSFTLGIQIEQNPNPKKRLRLATLMTTVDTSRCCDRVSYVQILRWTTQQTWTGRWSTGPWKLDDSSGWYPYVDVDTSSEIGPRYVMDDTPGLEDRFFFYSAFLQEFETCAVCIKSAPTGSFRVGCVLGCYQWSHSWVFTPYYTGRTINRPTAVTRPSSIMSKFLDTAQKSANLIALTASCDSFGSTLCRNYEWLSDRAASGRH